MKRFAVGCGLLAIAVAGPVYAGFGEPFCCACFIEDHEGTVPAFFCVSPTNEAEQIAAADRCDDTPMAQLFCLARPLASAAVTDECVDQLREAGITCPAGPGAPALGNLALAGLALLLGMLGAVTLRRRQNHRG